MEERIKGGKKGDTSKSRKIMMERGRGGRKNTCTYVHIIIHIYVYTCMYVYVYATTLYVYVYVHVHVHVQVFFMSFMIFIINPCPASGGGSMDGVPVQDEVCGGTAGVPAAERDGRTWLPGPLSRPLPHPGLPVLL